MSPPREVLIRILSAITKEDVNWNKKSHFKMLKMALFDFSINDKCFSVDWGRGSCPLFSSQPRGIRQLKSPHPREFAIQGKKILMPGGQPVEGGEGTGRRWNWLMHMTVVSACYSIPHHEYGDLANFVVLFILAVMLSDRYPGEKGRPRAQNGGVNRIWSNVDLYLESLSKNWLACIASVSALV